MSAFGVFHDKHFLRVISIGRSLVRVSVITQRAASVETFIIFFIRAVKANASGGVQQFNGFHALFRMSDVK